MENLDSTSFWTLASTTPSNVTDNAYLWAGKSDAHRVIEIIYLTVLAATGSLGNLTVIFSIILERRIHANGNIFVINLAIADLLITGFVVPTVIANVAYGGNALGRAGCFVAGYVVTVTCTCSVCNLTFIAINRYFAVVRSTNFKKTFTRKKVYLMVAGIWLWSNFVSIPTYAGNWSIIVYDPKMELCSWDDTHSLSYTIVLVSAAILIPLLIITFCYIQLFKTVRTSGKWVRGISRSTSVIGIHPMQDQRRRSMRKERNLLQTLATAVAFFCICWLPYGSAVIIDAENLQPLLKKSFGWLGLSNSAVNFVIYGLMNPVFRKGYLDLFNLVFGCKTPQRKDSKVIHGSINSDSMYRSATRKRSSLPGTPISQPRAITVITTNGSNGNLRQCKTDSGFFQSSVTPQFMRSTADKFETIDSHDQDKSSDTQVKLQSSLAESLAALRRPSTLFKRDKSSVKNADELEEKQQVKQSLMLLQLQIADDVEIGPEPRRSKSENRNGVKNKPEEKQRSSSASDARVFVIENEMSYIPTLNKQDGQDAQISNEVDADTNSTWEKTTKNANYEHSEKLENSQKNMEKINVDFLSNPSKLEV